MPSTPLDKLSKEDLIYEVVTLREELAELKRLVFGNKSERFVPVVADEQLSIGLITEEKQPEVKKQEITYSRTQAEKPNKHHGRMPLPAHLPRVEHLIEPEVSTEGMKKIGEEITETLEYIPGKLLVNKYVRPKYAKPEGEGVVIGTLPTRLIEKGIAEASLLAFIITGKYVDHLPLHRQIEILKRLGIKLPASTVSDWVSYGLNAIKPLYEALLKQVKEASYLQVDETPIKVLDKEKKGDSHRGYYWVYHAVKESLVVFDYQEGRSREGPNEILKNFSGYLQTDGYGAYDAFGERKDIVQLHCMAHARRCFEKALNNDRSRAEYALIEMQKLYAIERECREAGINYEDRKKQRQDKAVVILQSLKTWMLKEYSKVTPESLIGKAIHYSLSRWEKLSVYTNDGSLEIDNNLVENAIRPVAIGRKNYLFAGSHDAAQRAAMIYSLFASCKKCDVNPDQWLKDVLNRISEHPINRIHELLPNTWKPSKM
jgi:transposase